jgi:hypothetical protein
MTKRYSEICPCNPANGGSGICGCVMGNDLVDDNIGYTITSTTSTNIDISAKKQSVVEWLFQEIVRNNFNLGRDLFEKAKEMDKHNIMDAYGQGVADEAGEIVDATKDAEEYYNNRYGK